MEQQPDEAQLDEAQLDEAFEEPLVPLVEAPPPNLRRVGDFDNYQSLWQFFIKPQMGGGCDCLTYVSSVALARFLHPDGIGDTPVARLPPQALQEVRACLPPSSS